MRRVHAPKLAEQPVHEGQFRYVGVDDHYFLAALLPGDRRARVEYRALTVMSDDGPRDLVDYRVRVAGDGPLRFFYGPKEFDLLQALSQVTAEPRWCARFISACSASWRRRC